MAIVIPIAGPIATPMATQKGTFPVTAPITAPMVTPKEAPRASPSPIDLFFFLFILFKRFSKVSNFAEVKPTFAKSMLVNTLTLFQLKHYVSFPIPIIYSHGFHLSNFRFINVVCHIVSIQTSHTGCINMVISFPRYRFHQIINFLIE